MTDACCVVYDGDLHILGGSNNATMHYKWDGTEWQSVSTLPISFSIGGAVSYNNKLHIISDTNHYAWNGTEWVVASTMPTSFKYGDVLALDKLYVIGCGTYCSQTYLWDGTDWEEGIALSVPLVDGTAVEMNDSIYCIGGKGYFKMCVKYGDDIICGSIDIEGN
jgi:N-acetylneuraminic acid mutarotase